MIKILKNPTYQLPKISIQSVNALIKQKHLIHRQNKLPQPKPNIWHKTERPTTSHFCSWKNWNR
ncbi:hypothetical protein [uncultured Gammaproteobacteria bacterium]|jgi:hypothetical protein|nr:hypothetical protein [uncultured Gammaproteobacteria bacterium]CAC9961607.1 hypothetical protein [uncultured Gammaproteobacteria bacterium]CAC9965390.1 hypothetical protein [uncultured Gammaproteobacteria bacterium]